MSRDIIPKVGGRYVILDARDPVMVELSGRILLLDAIENRIPAHGFYSVIGRIEGDKSAASLNFSAGVRLGRARPKQCSCPLYSFRHEKSGRCL